MIVRHALIILTIAGLLALPSAFAQESDSRPYDNECNNDETDIDIEGGLAGVDPGSADNSYMWACTTNHSVGAGPAGVPEGSGIGYSATYCNSQVSDCIETGGIGYYVYNDSNGRHYCIWLAGSSNCEESYMGA